MKGLFNITYTTASQARREPIYYIITGIFGALVYLSQYFVLFVFQGEEAVVMETGIASITACGYLLALLLGWLLVRKEMEQMSILTVLSKPVSRFSFVSGKYLGLLYAISLAVVFLFLMFCLNLWQFDGHRVLDQVEHQLYERYLSQYQGASTDDPVQSQENSPGEKPNSVAGSTPRLPTQWTVISAGAYTGLQRFATKWMVPGLIGTIPAWLGILMVLSITTVFSVFFEVLATTGFTVGFLIAGSLSGSLFHILTTSGTALIEKVLGWTIHLLIPDLFQLNIATNVGSRLHMTAWELTAYFLPFLQYAVITSAFFVAFVLCVGTATFQRQEIT